MGYAGDFRGFYRKSLGQNENFIRYFEFDHIKSHESHLEELLDLNFGKDWRIFLLLYYSGPLCRHHCRYAPFDQVEDANLSWVKRKGYFARAKLILKKYFSEGYEATLTEIKEDKHRFIWNKQYIISSDLFNLSLQKRLEKNGKEKALLEEKREIEKEKRDKASEIQTEYCALLDRNTKLMSTISELEAEFQKKESVSEADWQKLEQLEKEEQRNAHKLEKLEQKLRDLSD